MRLSIVSLLVVIVLVVGPPSAYASNLRHAIETAEVIQTFPLDGIEVQKGKLGNDVVVLQIAHGDSSVIAGYTFDGHLLFWNSYSSDVWLNDMSEDGTTFVYGVDAERYQYRHLVVDTGGHEVCQLSEIRGSVQVSPSGDHFCAIPNSIESNRFRVYDRSCTPLDFDLPDSWGWNARFLSDTNIAHASYGAVQMVNLRDGEADSISVPLWMEYSLDFPLIHHVPSSRNWVTYTQDQLIAVSESGQVLLHLIADGYIGYVFVSDLGNHAIATVRRHRDTLQHFEIYDLVNDGVAYSVRSHGLPRGGMCSGCPDIASMDNGIISMIGSGHWTKWNSQHSLARTCFAEFDPESMTISEPFAVHGIYLRARGETVPSDTYLRVYPPDTVQLVRLNR